MDDSNYGARYYHTKGEEEELEDDSDIDSDDFLGIETEEEEGDLDNESD
jgi:hypothetical protein